MELIAAIAFTLVIIGLVTLAVGVLLDADWVFWVGWTMTAVTLGLLVIAAVVGFWVEVLS